MDRKIIPQNPTLSYFMPKSRIKVPKLPYKTMQKRFHHGCNINDADGDDHRKQHCTKTKKPGKLLTTKISSVVVKAFGSMRFKSPERNGLSDGGKTKSKTKSNSVVGEHGGSGNLNGAPSKLMVTGGWKSRTGRSLGKMLNLKQEGREGEELCKKRILMGGKCKPLSLSGSLEYDQNGILVTDIIP